VAGDKGLSTRKHQVGACLARILLELTYYEVQDMKIDYFMTITLREENPIRQKLRTVLSA
jgi:hypothetical protein